ncbi:MAG TPA: hypothetical protein PLK82_07285 [Bacteroidales bacterium]|nr:hypothetical protein [Bacteroidales bacterium]
MKSVSSLLLTILVAASAQANVTPPKAFISEVFFSSSGDWTIELGFYPYYYSEFDSILIESSSGSSRISQCSSIAGGGWPNFDSLAVITSANLVYPVAINPLSDYIKVSSYMFGYVHSDYLAIGNYPGSVVDCRQGTESIIYITYFSGGQVLKGFCIDQSPTIGFGNDTTGAMATYSGMVFDPSGNVFPEGLLYIPPTPMSASHSSRRFI